MATIDEIKTEFFAIGKKEEGFGSVDRVLLEALRRTQLDQDREMAEIRQRCDRLERKFDALNIRLIQAFGKLDVDNVQITALLKRIDRSA